MAELSLWERLERTNTVWSIASAVFTIGLAVGPALALGGAALAFLKIDWLAAVLMASLGLLWFAMAYREWKQREPRPANRACRYGAHVQGKAIRLGDLADEYGFVTDKTIEDCDIWGPAVLVIFEGDDTSHFHSCDWTPSDARWKKPDHEPIGAIRLRRITFRQCRFRNVGLVEQALVPTVRGSDHHGESPTKAVMHITEEEVELKTKLVTRAWTLTYRPADGKNKRIAFDPDGRIGTGRNDNEDRWEVDGDLLILRRSNGRVHNRFRWNPAVNRLESTNDPDTYALSFHKLRDQRLEPIEDDPPAGPPEPSAVPPYVSKGIPDSWRHPRTGLVYGGRQPTQSH